MAYQAVFKRYELKYLITDMQKAALLDIARPYMRADKYGLVTIRNLYFDTDNYRLIRRSLEKPSYKEKLRIRSYCKAADNTTVFAELKKKYKHVVYKRRIALPYGDAMAWLCGGTPSVKSQITEEIDYFCRFYGDVHPTVLLSYDRQAYYALDGSDFRMTFDSNILSRQDNLSLCTEIGGTPILEKGYTLMELKTSGAIPLWMTHFLSENGIYKTSFSKYGRAYVNEIFENQFGGKLNA